jgi:hypothetical protein
MDLDSDEFDGIDGGSEPGFQFNPTRRGGRKRIEVRPPLRVGLNGLISESEFDHR